jgi:hypothetical protein
MEFVIKVLVDDAQVKGRESEIANELHSKVADAMYSFKDGNGSRNSRAVQQIDYEITVEVTR